MSRDPDQPDEKEGWESLGEEPVGSLAPNSELEDAMREAMDAVEARQEAKDGPAGSGGEDSAEAAALRDRLIRLQADFENFRKRTLKEREETFRYGHENLVKDLLPTVDNLERAIEHVRDSDSGDLDGLLQGVELVLRELRGVLEKHGVEAVEADGQSFDPAIHEAMAQQPSESVAPNTVIQVFEKGYRLRDRLLRPARVVVASAPSGGDEEKDEPES